MRKQLAIISLLTAASQLAAFLKLWFTARIFGIGPELDGYNLALVLPRRSWFCLISLTTVAALCWRCVIALPLRRVL